MRFMDWINGFIGRMNLTEKDRKLIGLCFRDTVTADETADYFDGIVFEECQYDVCCLIAQMCSKHHYAGAPEPLIPKIQGLIRYLTTMNAFRIVELFKFVREINRAGIPVMLTKGAAIRVAYYPKLIRYMADTDIYVARKDFDRTAKLAKDYGCESRLSFHSVELKKGPLAVDVHKVFVKELLNGANSDGIWRRAFKSDQKGVSFYIPSKEDMIVQILVTGFYNVLESSCEQEKKHVRWIIDILPFLLDERKIDWKKVVRIAEQLRISDQVKVMIFALGDILPHSIDTETVIGYFRKKEAGRRAIRVFDELYSLYGSPCEHLAESKGLPEVILYWAQNTWIKCSYFSGHENVFRAVMNYPEFCMVTLKIGGIKELPGELIRRICRRARTKRGV